MKSVVSPLLWLNCKLGSFTYDKFSKLAYKAMQRRWQKPSEVSFVFITYCKLISVGGDGGGGLENAVLGEG